MVIMDRRDSLFLSPTARPLLPDIAFPDLQAQYLRLTPSFAVLAILQAQYLRLIPSTVTFPDLQAQYLRLIPSIAVLAILQAQYLRLIDFSHRTTHR